MKGVDDAPVNRNSIWAKLVCFQLVRSGKMIVWMVKYLGTMMTYKPVGLGDGGYLLADFGIAGTLVRGRCADATIATSTKINRLMARQTTVRTVCEWERNFLNY